MNDRFFILSCSVKDVEGKTIVVHLGLKTKGKFLNRRTISELVKKQNEAFIDPVIVTFLLEVNEQDFNDWNEVK